MSYIKLIDSLQVPGMALKSNFSIGFKNFIKDGAKSKPIGVNYHFTLGEHKIELRSTRVKIAMIPSREVSALEASVIASYISKGLITESLFATLVKEVCMQNLSVGELRFIEGGNAEKLLMIKGDTNIFIEN